MSNVLVIHLDDRSTDFLKLVYKDKGYDIINDGNTPDSILREEIKKHDKIIMLGHGLPGGLINVNRGDKNSNIYFINDTHADLLREKETVSVWCFSDQFFKRNHIPGFHTGMIISEVSEAMMVLGFSPLDKTELLTNMELMSDMIGNCIEKTPQEMKNYLLKYYIYTDEISRFNRLNFTVLDSEGNEC